MKKPWYRKIGFSVEYWWVWVEAEGKILKLSCWAGIDSPTIDSLLYSIKKKLDGADGFKHLVGKEYDTI